MDLDFLNIGEEEFDSLKEINSYISENVDLSRLSGDLNIIGSVSNFRTVEEVEESIQSHFEIERSNGKTLVLKAKYVDAPYLMFLSDGGDQGFFPIFFTLGRKTKEIPKSIDKYFRSEIDIGRLWISKREMEELRRRVVDSYPRAIMPYFTASRSRFSESPATYRPRYERTIQYYGDDGLETFEEMKRDYGVLPTNLKFQKANEFKFRVTTKGIFTIKKRGLSEALDVIEDSINRLRKVKKAIDTSSFSIERNRYAQESNVPLSRPWAIALTRELDGNDIRRFKREELNEDWEFNLASLEEPLEEGDNGMRFTAELKDDRGVGKTVLRSHDTTIRVYPREKTGIDQDIRVFGFVSDQIDPNARAVKVSS